MKTTDTKTKTRCHCGDKAKYIVKIDYVWRGTVSTPEGKRLRIFSNAHQTSLAVCEDCYPDTKLLIEAKVPTL